MITLPAENAMKIDELHKKQLVFLSGHKPASTPSQSLQPEILAGEGTERITQYQITARLGTVRQYVARSLKELRSNPLMPRALSTEPGVQDRSLSPGCSKPLLDYESPCCSRLPQNPIEVALPGAAYALLQVK